MASLRRIVAVCQMTSKNDKQSNLKTCSELIKHAKERQAQMVFLPETCDFIGESKAEMLASAEPPDGETMQKFCQMAKDNQVWLSVGGVLQKVGEKVRNAHVIINSDGEVVSKYHKIHLFDVDIPEQNVRLMESEFSIPGDEITPPVETPVGKVGLSICYDMRFPEQSLTLTKMGADILAYPSAFTFTTGSAHWEPILRARAIECQCYVIAAAQTGVHNKKRSSWGHAMIVDPWGAIIAQCSEGTGIATAELDMSYLKQVRRNMPVWEHRRNDLYPALPSLDSNPKLVPYDQQQEYKFGHTSVKASGVFYKTDKTLAFTNLRCVAPGRILLK
ncbi:Nitrilase and fragile histidine triad fusion protein NitFhit [Blattella germanica]|nr:Nitrilase and fragile histidine triad fusion protein NitFhit [Blattella germanica]